APKRRHRSSCEHPTPSPSPPSWIISDKVVFKLLAPNVRFRAPRERHCRPPRSSAVGRPEGLCSLGYSKSTVRRCSVLSLSSWRSAYCDCRRSNHVVKVWVDIILWPNLNERRIVGRGYTERGLHDACRVAGGATGTIWPATLPATSRRAQCRR